MKIGGLVENRDLTLYRLTALKDKPGAAGQILRYFALHGVNIEYITESSTADGSAVMAICVKSVLADRIDAYLVEDEEIKGAVEIIKIEPVTVLGIYGPHFREKPKLAARFCQILGEANINILGLSSSISSICSVIRDEERTNAKNAILNVFQLP
jgi:aspartokinase